MTVDLLSKMGSSASKKDDVIPKWKEFLAGMKAVKKDAEEEYIIACEKENNATGERQKEQFKALTEEKLKFLKAANDNLIRAQDQIAKSIEQGHYEQVHYLLSLL